MIPWALLVSKTWPILVALIAWLGIVYMVRFLVRRWKNLS